MQRHITLLALLSPFKATGPVLVSLERCGYISGDLEGGLIFLEKRVQCNRLVVPRAFDERISGAEATGTAFYRCLAAIVFHANSESLGRFAIVRLKGS